MSPLRTVPQAKINFLFFQDIITSVMGILILITLMLSLSLNSDDPTTPQEERLQQELLRDRGELTRIENENRAAQQRILTAGSLPDRTVLEARIEALRIEEARARESQRQSEQALASSLRAEHTAQTNRENAASLAQAVTNLTQRISGLREELARAKTNGNVVYLTAADELRQVARRPIVFLVGAEKIEERKSDGGAGEEKSLANGAESMRPILARLDPARDYVVFFLRPSGVKWFAALRDLARKAGFEVGYDAIEEQQEIIFGAP